jgi:hypothetical protein
MTPSCEVNVFDDRDASPDHAPHGAFLHVWPTIVRRRSVRLDRCEATRRATRLGLVTCLLWVKLGGKGTSATRLVVPNEQTLAGVGGRSLQCQHVWPGRALQDGVPRPTNVRAATMY